MTLPDLPEPSERFALAIVRASDAETLAFRKLAFWRCAATRSAAVGCGGLEDGAAFFPGNGPRALRPDCATRRARSSAELTMGTGFVGVTGLAFT